ncbi:DUF6503 family protein [Poritiphilus flavus]|uniref:Deoxyribose-phosphate aldolase n=1 Tax=Poritiphilus flavus TaxID=2697053 RepID=A0A6L9EF58_9FLAO|nr:DUF6503 family protein [Poritiphilus flavus]NAS13404.1 deoxyribose-phosphate aldolase [Poritiphilus flavus]
MRYYLLLAVLVTAFGCRNEPKEPVAQEIIDKAIEVSGGPLYTSSNFSFEFRDRKYTLERDKEKILKRITLTDSSEITDIKEPRRFRRLINGEEVQVVDSMARKYANSVNSVHYFAYLPYGLNDPAVNKKYLGEEDLKGQSYYKVEVTFDQQGGGDDFEDTYIYWFNKQTFKPDYLAYDYHTDGGGMRFREAFNERYVGGIRFVDYNNYKPESKDIALTSIGKLFEEDKLELLSKVELDNVVVNPGNYN